MALSGKGTENKNKKDTRRGNMKIPQPSGFWGNVTMVIVAFAVLIGIYMLFANPAADVPTVPISQVAQELKSSGVQSITVVGDDVTATHSDGKKEKTKKETEQSLTAQLAQYGVTNDELSKVKITVETPSGFSYWALNLLPFILPFIAMIAIIWLISRQVRGAGMQAFTFGQSKARFIDPNDKSTRVTFKDVAGVKEAKEELSEIVDFLKNPRKFLDIGARIPKGVLLMGGPGTGKTLLARAVAGEAGVPFFSISGSEFVEMFVGVGASRVRDLFKMAKKAAPAIIFVDEIDAVGRIRGAGTGGGNDEREQTLNQILVEMDGFEPNEKVIVMAATNRPDVLDPALLRPGRFDRRVIIDLPDVHDRAEILRIHAVKKPLAEDVDLEVIAQRTPGFSGADLYSLMNEAAILAAREDRKTVSQYDLLRSIEKVMLGPERKSHILSKKEKEITAYHEAGHALVASILPDADPVHKISIVSRGHAGGYTLKLPFEEKKLQSRKAFLDDIAVSLGGYVVEKMIYDDLTTGPSNDLMVASALARDMVMKYGMSDKIGPMTFEDQPRVSMIGRKLVSESDYSQEVAATIDQEVAHIMREAYTRAENTVTTHRKALDAIATELIRVETLERAEFEKLLIANGITPKKQTIDILTPGVPVA